MKLRYLDMGTAGADEKAARLPIALDFTASALPT